MRPYQRTLLALCVSFYSSRRKEHARWHNVPCWEKLGPTMEIRAEFRYNDA